MPPWHIDKNVGIQEFKNDRSLSDQEIDTIARWVDGGAPMGDPKDMPRADRVARRRRSGTSPSCSAGRPISIVKSPSFTMPAHAQDAWDKRSTPSGVTEPRWVRAIEIRPATNKGRKIVHHALARLSQDDPIDNARPPPTTTTTAASTPGRASSWNGRSASRARSCAPTPASCCCPARSSCGTSTTPPPARRSPTTSSSASTSTRKARSRSTARCCT